MKTVVRPAGAAPADRFGSRFYGRAQDDFLHVVVNGEPFVASVSPDRAEMWERLLHADYAKTDSYRALFNAGLLLTEMMEIDLLVTGLPVSQFQDESIRRDLEKRFSGEHQVTPKRTINVKKVRVVAKPIGGHYDYLNESENGPEYEQITEEHRILVVDPGFYSLDWLMVSNGQIQRQSSGTSIKASYVFLEQAGVSIFEENGSKQTAEFLENVIRSGLKSILLAGQRAALAPYLKAASESLAPITATSIPLALRTENISSDIIVLVGGGSVFSHKTIQDAFRRLKGVSPMNPALANTREFWLYGGSL